MTLLAAVNALADFDEYSASAVEVTADETTYDALYVKRSINMPNYSWAKKLFTPSAGDTTYFRFRLTNNEVAAGSYNSGTDTALEIADASGNIILSAAKESSLSGYHAYTLFGETNEVSTGEQWYGTRYVLIKLKNTGTATVAKIYYDDDRTPTLTLTVADRQTRTMPASIYLRPGRLSGYRIPYWHLSELMVSSSSLFGARLIEVPPSTAGDEVDFTGTIADLIDADTATGLSSSAKNHRQSFVGEAYGGPSLNIESVLVNTVAHRSLGVPDKLAVTLRIGGTNYDGTNTAVDLTTRIQHLWPLNPATSGQWTTAALATTQAGLKTS